MFCIGLSHVTFLLAYVVYMTEIVMFTRRVIAVSKSQEFLLKVRRLSLFFSTTTQEIRLRRRVDVVSTTSDTITIAYAAIIY